MSNPEGIGETYFLRALPPRALAVSDVNVVCSYRDVGTGPSLLVVAMGVTAAKRVREDHADQQNPRPID